MTPRLISDFRRTLLAVLLLGVPAVIHAAITSVTLTSAPPSPQPLGRSMLLQAAVVGGANVQYLFETSPDGNAWSALGGWSTSSQCFWNPTTANTAAAAPYRLRLSAREGSAGAVIVSAPMPYLVAPTPPVAVTGSASPAAPRPVAGVITITAAALGGTASTQLAFDASLNGVTTASQRLSPAKTWSWMPGQPGTYVIKVTACEPLLPASPVTMQFVYQITPALTGVSAAAFPPLPQPVRTSLTFTATATGGAQDQYAFTLTSGSTMVASRALGTLPTWNWVPTTDGALTLTVTARDVDGTQRTATLPVTITPPPLLGVSLTSAKASPQQAGAAIPLTAVSLGGSARVQYLFESYLNTAQMAQNGPTTLNTWNWTPTTAGTYTLKVTASDPVTGSSVFATRPFIILAPLTGVTLSATPPTRQIIGHTTALTAQPVGGNNVEYQFTLDGVTLRDWSPLATAYWTPQTPGTHTLLVTARESGTVITATGTLTYSVSAVPPTGVQLTVNNPSPQPRGRVVTLSATPVGGANVEYLFQQRKSTDTNWTNLNPAQSAANAYTRSPSIAWQPGQSGQYQVQVLARESTWPDLPVTAQMPFVITDPLTSLSTVTFTVSPASPVQLGTALTLNAGCADGAQVQYTFTYRNHADGTTGVIRGANTSATLYWQPATAGHYDLTVRVQDVDGGTASQTVNGYIVASKLTSLQLQAAPDSPQPLTSLIHFTAVSTPASATLEYQYLFSADNGLSWQTDSSRSDFTADATCDWAPPATGSYLVRVDARDPDYPDAVVSAVKPFIITEDFVGVNLSVNPAGPQPLGATPLLTAVPTGGAQPQYTFFMGMEDAGGLITWSILPAADPTRATLLWTPATAGRYWLFVQALDGAAGCASAIQLYVISPTPPSRVTLAAADSSALAILGATVTLAAAVNTQSATVEYAFDVSADGGATWAPANATASGFQARATLTWKPVVQGTYLLRVEAREHSLPTAVVSALLSYRIVAPFTSVTLTCQPAAPQPVATAIQLTATPQGGIAPQYRFTATLGGSVTVLRDYAANATVTWVPTVAGAYTLAVQALDSTVTRTNTQTYLVSPVLPSTVTLIAGNGATMAPLGSTVTLIAATNTGSATVEYQYDVSTDGGTTWTPVNAAKAGFIAAASITWQPASVGTFLLRVSAREHNLPAVVITGALTYQITTPLSGVALAVAPVGPQPVNAVIRLTATPTGGARVLYRFTATLGGVETVLRDTDPSAVCTWQPNTPGSYTLAVTATEGAGAQNKSTQTYRITAAPPTTVALAAPTTALTTHPADGTAITLTASSDSTSATVQYKFEASLNNGLTWQLLQDYAAVASYPWIPTQTGSYLLRVSARESLLPAAPAVSSLLPYTIVQALTSVTVSAAPSSPQPINTPITLLATPIGGMAVGYVYEACLNGATWTPIPGSGVTALWTPTQPGAYQVRVTANETPRRVVSPIITYIVSSIPPSQVLLSAAPVSPQPTGRSIVLVATAIGGHTVEYQFEVSLDNGVTWPASPLQPFSTAASCSVWTPLQVGSDLLRVTARERTLPLSTVSTVLPFSVTAPLTKLTLTTTPADATQPVGTRIALTVVATGGAQPQYQFLANGVVIRDYAPTPALLWIPTTLGPVTLQVNARDGASGAAVVNTTVAITITAPPTNTLLLVANPSAPIPALTNVTLSAFRGGVNQYAFEVSADGGITWGPANVTAAGFHAASTLTWTPASAGSYLVRVTAGTPSVPTSLLSRMISYTVTPVLTDLMLTTSLASPQVVGTRISILAAATGGAQVQYRFRVNGATLQDFSAQPSAVWTPTSPGVYTLEVVAREGNTLVTRTLAFPISALPPSGVRLATAPVGPQPVGNPVTLTATPLGGTNIRYKFEVSADGGSTWPAIPLQDFAAPSTCVWQTSGLQPGLYLLRVTAQETNAAVSVIASQVYPLVTPLSTVTLTPLAASPAPVGAGISLAATALGGAQVQYQFFATPLLSANSVSITGWSSLANVTWQPQPGTYTLAVAARDLATPSAAPVLTVLPAPFVIAHQPPTTVTLQATPAAPQSPYTPVLLIAGQTGGNNATVEYKFEVSAGSGANWTTLADFADGMSMIDWVPTASGTYYVRVTARDEDLPGVMVTTTLLYLVK